VSATTSAHTPSPGETGKVVGWGLVFYAGVQLAGFFLASNDLGAAAVQAALSEWGAGRVGIAWSDPLAKVPTWGAIARRAGSGAALGFGAGVLALVVLLVTHGATLARGTPALGSLAIGLLVSVLWAVRDELLLRGFVLRALGGWPSPAVCAVVCGVAGAAAELGAEGASPQPIAIAVAGVLGVAFAALWQRDRGAWMAVAAHASWLFTTRKLSHGAFLDVHFAPTAWGGGDAEMAGSSAALVVVAALALAGIAANARAAAAAASTEEPR
jgi:membrane protease YdiL (CAAX protease family)